MFLSRTIQKYPLMPKLAPPTVLDDPVRGTVTGAVVSNYQYGMVNIHGTMLANGGAIHSLLVESEVIYDLICDGNGSDFSSGSQNTLFITFGNVDRTYGLNDYTFLLESAWTIYALIRISLFGLDTTLVVHILESMRW